MNWPGWYSAFRDVTRQFVHMEENGRDKRYSAVARKGYEGILKRFVRIEKGSADLLGMVKVKIAYDKVRCQVEIISCIHNTHSAISLTLNAAKR